MKIEDNKQIEESDRSNLTLQQVKNNISQQFIVQDMINSSKSNTINLLNDISQILFIILNSSFIICSALMVITKQYEYGLFYRIGICIILIFIIYKIICNRVIKHFNDYVFAMRAKILLRNVELLEGFEDMTEKEVNDIIINELRSLVEI